MELVRVLGFSKGRRLPRPGSRPPQGLAQALGRLLGGQPHRDDCDTYICIYMCTHIFRHTCMCICIRMNTCLFLHLFVHLRTYTYLYTYIHMYIYIYREIERGDPTPVGSIDECCK